MTDAERVVRIPADVAEAAEAAANRFDVPLGFLIGLATKAGLDILDDSAEASAAQDQLRSLAMGSGITPQQLGSDITEAGVTSPVLAVKLGQWIPEVDSGPLERTGRGYRDSMSDADLVGAASGYWRAKPGATHLLVVHDLAIVAVMKTDPSRWKKDEGGRIFHPAALLVRGPDEVDPATGHRQAVTADDLAILNAVRGRLLVLPAGARNPAIWIRRGWGN